MFGPGELNKESNPVF